MERYFGAGAPRHRRVGCGHICREYIHNGVMELRRRVAESSLSEDDPQEEFEDAEFGA